VAEGAVPGWLQILALGGCGQADMAAQLGLDEATVVAAERLFFDVRPALAARGWVACAVIRPEEKAGRTDLAARLRMAYFGGPLVTHLIVVPRNRGFCVRIAAGIPGIAPL